MLRTSLTTSKASPGPGALSKMHQCFRACFFFSSKALNKEYEEYVLTVGDFDERVFLGADADEEIGTPRKIVRESSTGQKNAEQQVEKLHESHICLPTLKKTCKHNV